MRISELSRVSRVPLPSIKYFKREGYLPSPDAPAHYGPQHLRRLRVIKLLTVVGGFSIAAAGKVLAALDNAAAEPATNPSLALPSPLGQWRSEAPSPEAEASARAAAQQVINAMHWQLSKSSPNLQGLVDALYELEILELAPDPQTLITYAHLAEAVARVDPLTADSLDHQYTPAERTAMTYAMVTPLLELLRRAAHENKAALGPKTRQCASTEPGGRANTGLRSSRG